MQIKSAIFLLSAVLLGATACDKEESSTATPEFAGSYEGYTLASCSYFQNTCTGDETITLTKNADGTASVAFTSASWGEFTVASAKVETQGDTCTLSGDGETRMGMGGNTSTYACSFTAEIGPSKSARMQFKVPAVMGGLTINFATGDAPADLLLAGKYEGYTDADCSYFENRYTDGESVTLTANGDGSLKVVFESATWGSFIVESATAAKEGDEYLFTGSGNVAMGMGGSTSEYAFTLSGRANTAKDDFSIAFNVPAVMGGLTVTLLPGSAPAAGE